MITTTQPPPAGYRNLHLVQSLQQHTLFTLCAFVLPQVNLSLDNNTYLVEYKTTVPTPGVLNQTVEM